VRHEQKICEQVFIGRVSLRSCGAAVPTTGDVVNDVVRVFGGQ